MEQRNTTTLDLLRELGERLRLYRVDKNLTQAETASKAGVGERTLRNLEQGNGGTVETLLRVLRAIDAPDPLGALAPKPQVSPMALLRSSSAPRRASRKRREGL